MFSLFISIGISHSPEFGLGHLDIVQKETQTLFQTYGEHPYNLSEPRTCLLSTQYPEWLSKIDDNILLSQLSLPGTHDTCSLYGGFYVETQELTLIEQLLAGVRFLDIRCRHINDIFAIHHGVFYQKIGFGAGVRDVCINFLKDHPTEFIFMLVKEEYDPDNNTQTFEETMRDYISGYEDFFYLTEKMPTLGEVRGKIVLLRRFTSGFHPLGNYIDYADDASFISETTIKCRVQDEYTVSTIFTRDDKWDAMKKLLDEARNSQEISTLYINYASGAGVGCFPSMVASYTNEKLGNYIHDEQPQFIGSLMIDFINKYYDELISNIIYLNNITNPIV